jgi:hypothetical protein
MQDIELTRISQGIIAAIYPVELDRKPAGVKPLAARSLATIAQCPRRP